MHVSDDDNDEKRPNVNKSQFSTAGNKEVLVFDVTTIPHQEDIKAADLRLFINQNWMSSSLSSSHGQPTVSNDNGNSSDSSRGNRRFLLQAHEILSDPNQVNNDEDLITRPLDSQLVDVTTESKWISMDILPAVRRWFENPRENFGIQLEILSPAGRGMWLEVRVHSDIGELTALSGEGPKFLIFCTLEFYSYFCPIVTYLLAELQTFSFT